MEWFWQFVESLHKSAVVVALQGFQPVDWIVLFVMLWGLAIGSRKGFSEMFGKVLGIFLVSMLVVSFYGQFADVITLHTLIPKAIANGFAFFLLTIFCWLSVSWCLNAFGKILKVEAQGLLKTLGGMVLGGLRMLLLMSFIVQFLLFLPIDALQKAFKQGRTYTGHALARLVPDLQEVVVGPFYKPDAKKKPLVTRKTTGG